MNIKLLNLTLLNFKGIRNLSIDFGGITNISGENATGKTTVFDAFTWLLFDKDSEDKKEFNIKTLDANNRAIEKIDHEVTGVLDCDGVHHTFKKTYREKWEKKKGSEGVVFTGHEKIYEYNLVPMSQKEYMANVSALLDESIAKLITNPLYFNNIKWESRRQSLIELSGGVTDSEIAAGNEAFEKLLKAAANSKNLDEYKKQIAASHKKTKDQLSDIPTRIDEANRSKPAAEDWTALEILIDTTRRSITEVDMQLQDKQTAFTERLKKITEAQREKHRLESKLIEVKNNAKQLRLDEISELETQLKTCTREINELEKNIAGNNNNIATYKNQIKRIEGELEGYRNDWNKINAETLTIDPKELGCPTCKRQFEAGKLEEIREKFTANFNENKSRQLLNITENGKSRKKLIEDWTKQISECTIDNESLNLKIAAKQAELDKLYVELQKLKDTPSIEPAEVKLLNQQLATIMIPDTITADDDTELKQRRTSLHAELDGIKQRLSIRDQITRIDTRIAELSAQEKELSQLLARLEKTEFTIDAFNKARIEAIEQKINGKFKLVKFKMFEQQINGGETECCECMVNGVPYSDVNTAGKINAGLDIINALTNHYGITAPIFIDNRESVNDLIPCESQIINLVVSRDKKLKIETSAPAAKQLELI